MKDSQRSKSTINSSTDVPKKKRLHWWHIILIGLSLFVLFIIGFLFSLPYLFNTRIANEYLNSYVNRVLNANVSFGSVRVDVWHHFPEIYVEIDSLKILSHSLDNVPAEIEKRLPSDASFLGSVDNISGGLDLVSTLKNKWKFSHIRASGIEVNIVVVDDTLNNFNIFPDSYEPHGGLPYISVESVNFSGVKSLKFTDVEIATVANLEISDIRILKKRNDEYSLDIKGDMNARVADMEIFNQTPFSISAQTKISFNPAMLHINDLRMGLAGFNSIISMNMDVGSNVQLNDFSCNIESLELISLWRYLAGRYFPKYSSIVNHVVLNTQVKLDNPYIVTSERWPVINMTIDSLLIQGRNLNAVIDARVFDLLNHPRFDCLMNGDIELTELERYIPAVAPYDISGTADISMQVDGSLESFTTNELRNLKLKGNLEIPICKLEIPGGYGNMKISNMEARFSSSDSLNPSRSPRLLLSADVKDIVYQDSSIYARGDNLSFSTSMRRDSLLDATLLSELPWNLKFKGTQMIFKDNNNQQHIRINGLRASLNSMVHSYNVIKGHSNVPEDILNLEIPHTPYRLDLHASDGLRNLFSGWDLKIHIEADSGTYRHGGYREPQKFNSLNLMASTDSINLNNINIASDNNSMCISLQIDSLRQTILGGENAQINARMTIDIDSVDFNQVAHTLKETHNQNNKDEDTTQVISSIPSPRTILIPRNLNLQMDLRAKEFEYTNLHLTNLLAHVNVNKGIVRLHPLKLRASFGNADISMVYDTSNVDSLSFGIDMDLDNIDVTKFFHKYNNLLQAMPELKNFSGVVGGKVDMKFLIFPNMYVDIPSIEGNIEAWGDSMEIKQNHFIRRVTRMMLVPFDSPLKIRRIHARGAIHDDMLQVYPFDIEFYKYKIQVMGINDFAGNLNYNISVEKMPIELFPFGIRIEGTYNNPKIRLSDGHYDLRRTQEKLSIIQDHKIYITGELMRLMNMLINHASKSYGKEQ